jgi:S-adenosylmethionine synthetase
MPRKNYLFTSESVSEGHPDKVCDRISDEVVDLFYREALDQGMDQTKVRVACETLATTNRVLIAGETRGPSSVTHEKIEAAARQAIRDIGYEQGGFHWQTARIEMCCTSNRPISRKCRFRRRRDEGAATRASCSAMPATRRRKLMPAPIHYAHRILKLLSGAPLGRARKALGPESRTGDRRIQERKPVAATQMVCRSSMWTKSHLQDMLKLVKPYGRRPRPGES